MESLVQAIIENSELYPNKIALIFEEEQITYKELAIRINSFASSLKNRKIKKGSRVIIETSDLLSFFCAFLGCHLSGCIAVPIEKNISIYKLHDIIKSVKPTLVFIKNNGEQYKDYFETISTKKIVFPKYESEATIVSTTGTTGNPSLVIHTNKSMLAETQNLCEGTGISEETILFTNIPFHLASGYRRVFAALFKGATAVITDKSVTLQDIGEYAKAYNVNRLSLVSIDVALITKEANENNAELLSNIRFIESVTDVFPYDIIMKFHNLFPHITLYNIYGTTESGCLLINNMSENFADGCIGKPSINSDVFIVDENGDRIETAGKYGYVAVRGNMNMKSYYKKKALTDQVMHDDTIVINDIVYFDENGNFYFVSRVGDVINVKGQKIIPTEIEKVAAHFNGIKDCVCAAKDDEKLGQVPILYVVCEDEESFNFEELKEYLKNNLESYRVPQDIISIEHIPYTSNGKVMRKNLSLMVK